MPALRLRLRWRHDRQPGADLRGRQSVFCNRADGLGVGMLRDAGYPMIIISTETNSVVARRAEKMDIPVLHGLKAI